MFKILFWLGLIGGGVFVGGQVIPVYYNEMKIDNVFEGVVKSNSVNGTEAEVRQHIHKLLKVQSIDMKALPSEFLENLKIIQENGKLQIGTEYHLVLWLMGKPTSIDPDGDYKASDVIGMDKLRLRLRMDFDFAPYQETP